MNQADQSRRSAAPITVGVAGRERPALAFAAREAALTGSVLRLVHAYTVPPAPPDFVAAAYGVDVEGTFRESGQAVLDAAHAFVAAAHEGVVVEEVLERGGAAGVLTAASRTSRLVVLGPDDSAPWYSRLFESRVARALAEGGACPVVVVPDEGEQRHRARGVTVVLDGMTVAHGALRVAFEHAARHGDTLQIVRLRSTEPSGDDQVPWHDMTRLVESWQAQHPEVGSQVRVVDGVADEETVEAYESTGLLVLARPEGSHRLALRHGSWPRAVIEHASCPVAVVPPDHEGPGYDD